jgi:hypothetical protein
VVGASDPSIAKQRPIASKPAIARMSSTIVSAAQNEEPMIQTRRLSERAAVTRGCEMPFASTRLRHAGAARGISVKIAFISAGHTRESRLLFQQSKNL